MSDDKYQRFVENCPTYQDAGSNSASVDSVSPVHTPLTIATPPNNFEDVSMEFIEGAVFSDSDDDIFLSQNRKRSPVLDENEVLKTKKPRKNVIHSDSESEPEESSTKKDDSSPKSIDNILDLINTTQTSKSEAEEDPNLMFESQVEPNATFSDGSTNNDPELISQNNVNSTQLDLLFRESFDSPLQQTVTDAGDVDESADTPIPAQQTVKDAADNYDVDSADFAEEFEADRSVEIASRSFVISQKTIVNVPLVKKAPLDPYKKMGVLLLIRQFKVDNKDKYLFHLHNDDGTLSYFACNIRAIFLKAKNFLKKPVIVTLKENDADGQLIVEDIYLKETNYNNLLITRYTLCDDDFKNHKVVTFVCKFLGGFKMLFNNCYTVVFGINYVEYNKTHFVMMETYISEAEFVKLLQQNNYVLRSEKSQIDNNNNNLILSFCDTYKNAVVILENVICKHNVFNNLPRRKIAFGPTSRFIVNETPQELTNMFNKENVQANYSRPLKHKIITFLTVTKMNVRDDDKCAYIDVDEGTKTTTLCIYPPGKFQQTTENDLNKLKELQCQLGYFADKMKLDVNFNVVFSICSYDNKSDVLGITYTHNNLLMSL